MPKPAFECLYHPGILIKVGLSQMKISVIPQLRLSYFQRLGKADNVSTTCSYLEKQG